MATQQEILDYLQNHEEKTGAFTAVHFRNGQHAETETMYNYRPVVDWITKFPKYIRGIDLKTGKFLIASTLYRFQ